MNKCVASEDGICRNVLGFGTKCNGYSDKCSLKPHYDNLQRMQESAMESVKKTFGIRGDKE